MRGDHPNYSIVEIGQNTKKSPQDLWRIAVTQTPVLEHKKMSEDHPNNSIVGIVQNTKKSPGDLKIMLSLKLQ